MRITRVLRPTRARVSAVCVSALVGTAIVLGAAGGATADDYPGQDDIARARAAAESQAATVADLDAAVAELETALHDAEAAQLLAADRYAQAQADYDAANETLATAKQRSADADAALKDAQSALAAVAQANYRDGGDLGQLGAVMTANGFEEAIMSSEALSRASDETATLVQRVQAAQLVADTMRDAAIEAEDHAAQAKADASDAYDDAVAAAKAADQAFTDAAQVRDDAVAALAKLNGTTIAMEKARQDGLAADRDKARKAAAKAAQEKAEQEQAEQAPPAPTKTQDPAPTKTEDPAPTKTENPAPSKAEDPAPEKTEDPAPTPPPASGNWKSTAAQGERAVGKALTLMGLPYRLGGTGPTYYDCSGLTMVSWKAAGISIQRSSQMQYNSLTHVPFSQLRKGDLIFYGTNRDAKKIYHVTIYIGGGMVAEATSPGKLSQIRPYDASWRIDDLIPLAGRP